MKFSEQWLREWVNPQISSEELCRQLTMAGLEVDGVHPVAGDFAGVVIGEIMAVAPHPDAKKLHLCEVNVGEEETLDIVCGAVNVKPMMKVPVAMISAILGADVKITKTTLRGVMSHGMLCSAKELGLAEQSDGIMELPQHAPIGDDFHHYLQLNDKIIDIDLTPNRGDCLSIAGIAREVAALNNTPVIVPEISKVTAEIDDKIPVKITAAEVCPRYCSRTVRGINSKTETPLWLQERLRRSGLRSIDPVVDVANYVMLELGQPMHAFDLQTVKQGITVRYAKDTEKLTLLDGTILHLRSSDCVIADDEKVLALAGIMGGINSGITAATQDILLEAAFFDPKPIALTARYFGLSSDGCYRFERGVDPELAMTAIERAAQLLLDIAGGKPGPVNVVTAAQHLPGEKIISLRRQRIARIIGIAMSGEHITACLEHLGMVLQAEDSGWQVQVPNYRFDINLEIDLIEEIARIYGYDKLPSHLPSFCGELLPVPEQRLSEKRIRQCLVDRGYHEAMTYSFVAPELQRLFCPDNGTVSLRNPISPELSVMRGSLWPGLIQALLHNRNRQVERVRLFEIGPRFINVDGSYEQESCLAGLAAGFAYPESWQQSKKVVDFFAVKSDLAALLQATYQPNEFSSVQEEHPALHPGQSAAIYCHGQLLGYLGALHPEIEESLDIAGPIVLFELIADNLSPQKLPSYKSLSKYQAVQRDIAIIIDETVPVSEILQQIGKNMNEMIKNVQIFDLYQGKGVDLGKKSLAFRSTIQHSSRTLIESEINELVEQVVNSLGAKFGATLR